IIRLTDLFQNGRWKKIHREDDVRLKELASQIPDTILHSKSANTFKNYNYAFKLWCKWCAQFREVNSMPASDYHVSLYIISIMQSSGSVSKINQAIYAITWAHQIAGEDNPCETFMVKSVVEGAKRQLSKPVDKKDPVTPEMLLHLVKRFGLSSNLYDKRIVTMCLVGYAGFLRFSEIVNIKACDLNFSDEYVSIFIEKSKTDKYREGRWVIIAKSDQITCPVNMLKTYISLANICLGDDIFIFRQMNFCKSTHTYKLRSSGQLSYTRVRELFLEKMSLLGYDGLNLGLHSLRSGGATAAANAGVPDRLFKKHGRWASDKAKDGYVRENLHSLMSVSQNLGI
ncbi:hypothetical protein FSP39_000438, partial [Pinctada imbricata]